jgi:hypothetical protein
MLCFVFAQVFYNPRTNKYELQDGGKSKMGGVLCGTYVPMVYEHPIDDPYVDLHNQYSAAMVHTAAPEQYDPRVLQILAARYGDLWPLYVGVSLKGLGKKAKRSAKRADTAAGKKSKRYRGARASAKKKYKEAKKDVKEYAEKKQKEKQKELDDLEKACLKGTADARKCAKYGFGTR